MRSILTIGRLARLCRSAAARLERCSARTFSRVARSVLRARAAGLAERSVFVILSISGGWSTCAGHGQSGCSCRVGFIVDSITSGSGGGVHGGIVLSCDRSGERLLHGVCGTGCKRRCRCWRASIELHTRWLAHFLRRAVNGVRDDRRVRRRKTSTWSVAPNLLSALVVADEEARRCSLRMQRVCLQQKREFSSHCALWCAERG